MGGGGELHASLLVELHKDCLNEKMRDDKVIRAHKGREFAKGKKWRGSFFRNLGVWGGRGRSSRPEATDDSEKRSDVYYSKERMLKESLVCPALRNLLNLVLSEHLQLSKDFHLYVGKLCSSHSGFAQ